MDDRRAACGFAESRLVDWAREALPEPDRRAITDHLADCAACRAAAARHDPAALFLGLRGASLPAEFWRGFEAGLAARIEADRSRSLPARIAGRLAAYAAGARAAMAWAPNPALWAAPAAMVLVLGVTVVALRHDRLPPGPRPPRVEAMRPPYAPPAGATRPAPAGRPMAAFPGVLPAGAGDPPALEEVASPSARVYRFDAAEAGADPIYFVVDESIEF